MSDFSTEYCELTQIGFPGDFSIEEEFKNLRESESISIICEGFGSVSIANIEGICNLGFYNGEEVCYKPLSEVLKIFDTKEWEEFEDKFYGLSIYYDNADDSYDEDPDIIWDIAEDDDDSVDSQEDSNIYDRHE